MQQKKNIELSHAGNQYIQCYLMNFKKINPRNYDMGKTYEYILDKEESIEKIRIAFSEEGHKIINETSLPYGIKFKCEDGASFILYFSKGRSSKIFFEKETEKTISIIDKICNLIDAVEPAIPVHATFSISKENIIKIKEEVLLCLKVVEKAKKKDTIDYLLEIAEGKNHLTITQFSTGKLLLQGPDSILVSQVKEIINKYEPISNKEEVLTYVEEGKQKITEQVIEQIEGFDEYCEKAIKTLREDAYNYLNLIDKKQIVTALGLLQAIKDYSISLPLYNPIVYPVAKAFEGFIIKMMIDKKVFTFEAYKENSDIAKIGNWLREKKFDKYIKDIKRDGYISQLLIAAWEGIRCGELHSDPAKDINTDLITIDQAEAKIGTVCNAITSAYNIIIKDGYTEEEMLERKSETFSKRKEVKEIPSFDCHIGTDESGKGDYFGPLVIAGVFVTQEDEKRLVALGVRDSKSNSDKRNIELSKEIIKALGYRKISVVCIGPERYNSLYVEMGSNLNKVLGWGHARAIENLLEENKCGNAIADQFGDETVIQDSLMQKGKKVELVQTPKAERDIAVAAASIIARAKFLEELQKLGEVIQETLSKGVSPAVESIAKKIYTQGGDEKLKMFVKMHFKTTQKIKNS